MYRSCVCKWGNSIQQFETVAKLWMELHLIHYTENIYIVTKIILYYFTNQVEKKYKFSTSYL